MDNIYGNTAASGEGGSANILDPGLHKVYVQDIEVVQIQTAKYNGEAADIKLVGVNGGTLSHRIFPFNFQADRTDFNGNLMDQQAQVDDYFGRLNHMLFKASGSKERYTTSTTGATGFADLMNRAKNVATKENGGVEYWQMVIADKNNYSRLPMWKGGCCEAINGDFPCTLKFDESKYGKKQPANAESTEAAGVNQLPFE